MEPWKTKARKTVLDNKPWLTVEQHTVELPDGQLIPNWPWIITPDYINVVAVTEDERFICFRQVKYGIEGTTLAVVGGYVNEGEAPLAAAQRELLEETGYEAPDWLSLGSYLVDPNRGIATGHLFLARQGTLCHTPRCGRSRRTGIAAAHTNGVRNCIGTWRDQSPGLGGDCCFCAAALVKNSTWYALFFDDFSL